MSLEQDRIKLLKIIEDYQKRILDLEEAQTNSAQERSDIDTEKKKLQKDITTQARKLLKVNKEISEMTKSYLGHQIELEDRIRSISDSQHFIRDIEKERINNYNTIDTSITGNLEKFNQLADLNIQMAGLSDDEISKMELLNIQYGEIEASIDRRGKGVNEQLKILEEQNTKARAYASLSETQKEIMEGQRAVIEGIQKTIMGTIETTVTLYGNLQGAIGGVITGAGFIVDSISEVNRELGFTIGDLNSAAMSAGALSFVFDDTVGTVKALNEEFGTLESATFGTQLNVGLISSNMGISNTEAVGLLGTFTRINGGSTDIASDMIKTTSEFAKQNNVAPAGVLSDMAQSAETIALFTDSTGTNMQRAAVQAAKLGTNMNTIGGIAEGLLDFETSITKELELGAMLGKNINLQKARQLAYDGKIGDAAEEALKAVGGIHAFNKMDPILRKQTADTLGISVGELQKMAYNQEHMNETGKLVQEKFSNWEESLNVITTKWLGTGLKTLGGWVTSAAQTGAHFSQMGFSLKGIGKQIGGLLSKTGGLGKKIGGMLGGGSSISGQVKPTTDTVPGKGIMEGMGKINMNAVLKGAAAMVIAAGAVFVFGKAVQEFMKVSWESVGMAVVSMLALVGAVALLGAIMSSGIGAVAILAGAAAMIVVAGAMYILGAAIQEMAIGFSAMGEIANIIGTLVGMVGSIGMLSAAFMGLAGSLMFLGTAGLVALPGLMAMSAIGEGIGFVGSVLGIGNNSSETPGAVEDGSLSEYQTQMLQKMDQLISATMSNRDVYIDKEKVTNVVMKTSERKSENIFGLGVA